jgi:hypothetical protein
VSAAWAGFRGGGTGVGGGRRHGRGTAVTYRCPRELDYSGESLPLALRSPNFLLRQPELPFGRCRVSELALAGVVRSDLCCFTQGSNSFVNFAEFVLKYRPALMQSF